MEHSVIVARVKLTDQMIIDMRRAASFNPDHGSRYHSDKYGIPLATVTKAMVGNTHKHPNAAAPPVVRASEKLTDEQVIGLRKLAKSGARIDYKHYAFDYKVSICTIEKAIRGDLYKRLNDVEAPFVKDTRKLDAKRRARELYQQGFTYPQIQKELSVSKSSISLWCRDLVASAPPREKRTSLPKMGEPPYSEYRLYSNGSKGGVKRVLLIHLVTQESISLLLGRYRMSVKEARILTTDERVLKRSGKSDHLDNLYIENRADRVQKRWQVASRDCAICSRPFIQEKSVQRFCSSDCRQKAQKDYQPSGNQVLTEEQVIEMRDTVRRECRVDLHFYAEKYEVRTGTILKAIKGETFARLNDRSPPIEKLPQPHRPAAPPQLEESLVTELMDLRKSDPLIWTYAALSKILREKTGKGYRGTHVAALILKRDPSLKALEAIRPIKVNIPRVRKERAPKTPVFHTLECVICERTFKNENPQSEVCWRKECHDITQTENAFS